MNVRNRSFGPFDQDYESDFSRAYTKLRLFDQKAGIGKLIRSKTVLDVGSSTGGFTNFALEKGAKKVVAVEIGSRQMDPRLVADKRVKLYEKIDILNVFNSESSGKVNKITVQDIDLALMDVSFVGCRDILLHLKLNVLKRGSYIILLFKPQFEAHENDLVNGIVKNSKMRREIIKAFEQWLQKSGFIVEFKNDSGLAGSKGNVERFYVLKTT